MRIKAAICHISFWRRAAFVVLSVSVLPLLIVAFYNRMPMLDDWHWMSYLYEAISRRENLGELFLTFAQNVRHLYLTEHGAYTNLFLSQFVPFLFHERLQFLTTYVTLIPLIIANLFAFHHLFGTLFHCPEVGDITGCMLSILEIHFLPQPLSAFYWYTAGIYYTTYYSLIVIQVSLMLLALIECELPRKRFFWICLLALLIEGGNLIITLLHVEIMLIFAVVYMIRLKGFSLQGCTMGIVSVVGFLVNVLAPSQTARVQSTVDEKISMGGW